VAGLESAGQDGLSEIVEMGRHAKLHEFVLEEVFEGEETDQFEEFDVADDAQFEGGEEFEQSLLQLLEIGLEVDFHHHDLSKDGEDVHALPLIARQR
jgi:hypothetical protein